VAFSPRKCGKMVSAAKQVYHRHVKPKPPVLPIPEPVGSTPLERLDWAFRTVLKASKEVVVPKAAKSRHRRRAKTLKPA
jgi:hypothetical protein